LYGICAPAVSASVKIPIQTKRLRFILLFNFVNQTPAIGGSCAASSRTASRRLSSKDLTGTVRTGSLQRVRLVADADEKETKLDAAFHAALK